MRDSVSRETVSSSYGAPISTGCPSFQAVIWRQRQFQRTKSCQGTRFTCGNAAPEFWNLVLFDFRMCQWFRGGNIGWETVGDAQIMTSYDLGALWNKSQVWNDAGWNIEYGSDRPTSSIRKKDIGQWTWSNYKSFTSSCNTKRAGNLIICPYRKLLPIRIDLQYCSLQFRLVSSNSSIHERISSFQHSTPISPHNRKEIALRSQWEWQSPTWFHPWKQHVVDPPDVSANSRDGSVRPVRLSQSWTTRSRRGQDQRRPKPSVPHPRFQRRKLRLAF